MPLVNGENNHNLRSGKITEKTGSTSSPSYQAAKMTSLINANTNILLELKDVGRKICDIEKSVEFLSAKYDEMKVMYDKVIYDNLELKKSNAEIKKINAELQNENKQIKEDIQNIQQQAIRNNVVVFGIPNVSHQQLKTTFDKIIDVLKIKPEDVQIDDLYQKKTQTNQAPVFFKFNNFKNKLDFMQTVKVETANKNKIFAHDIGFPNNNNKIAFMDQLTDSNRHLLREAQSLRSHGYKYIWTKNGKIFTRQNDNDDIIIIKTLTCIESLKSENNITI